MEGNGGERVAEEVPDYLLVCHLWGGDSGEAFQVAQLLEQHRHEALEVVASHQVINLLLLLGDSGIVGELVPELGSHQGARKCAIH